MDEKKKINELIRKRKEKKEKDKNKKRKEKKRMKRVRKKVTKILKILEPRNRFFSSLFHAGFCDLHCFYRGIERCRLQW